MAQDSAQIPKYIPKKYLVIQFIKEGVVKVIAESDSLHVAAAEHIFHAKPGFPIFLVKTVKYKYNFEEEAENE